MSSSLTIRCLARRLARKTTRLFFSVLSNLKIITPKLFVSWVLGRRKCLMRCWRCRKSVPNLNSLHSQASYIFAQQILRSNETLEKRLLQLSLGVFQRHSNHVLPKSLPKWYITSFEVDILDAPELGRGSFGVVKKAMWGKTLVAVKMPAKETSEKVVFCYWPFLR